MFSLGTCSLLRRPMVPRVVGIVALVLGSLATLVASRCEAAGIYTWTGTFNTDWQAPGNWAPARTLLDAHDVLQFRESATVTNVPTQTIRNLVLSDNASVTLQAATDNELTIATLLLPETGLDVPSGCTLTTGPGLILTLGSNVTASIGGTLAVGGAFTNTLTTTIDGTLQFNAGGSWSGVAPAYGASSTLIYATGSTFGRGDEWYTANPGFPANVQISNSTTLDLGANGGAAVTRAMSGNLTIDAGSKLRMSEPGPVMTGNLIVSGDVTVSGTLQLGAGSRPSETGSISVGGNWTISPGGSFVIGGASDAAYWTRVLFNGAGTQVISAPGELAFPCLFIDKTSGIVRLACDVRLYAVGTAGLLMDHGDLDLNGHTLSTFLNHGPYIVVNNGPHTIDSSLPARGTVYFESGGGLSVITRAGSGSLVFGDSVTVDCPGDDILTPVTINGVIETWGNLGAGLSYGPNSILRYKVDGRDNLGVGRAWVGSGPGAPMNVEITVTPGHSATVGLIESSDEKNTPHLVRGKLTVGAGCTFNQNAVVPLTVQGNLSVAGTMGLTGWGGSGGDLEVGGNWTRAGTFTPNGRVVTFNGWAPQTIFSTTTFDNLTVNGAGVILNNDDITVNQALTFTSGNITTGAKKVVIGPAGSISHTSGHVVGNLQLPVAAGTPVSKTFVIGDSGNYTPVDVVFGNVTTPGNLTASTTPGDHPQLGSPSSKIDPGLSVNRYWTLTNGGVVFDHYDATLNFWPSDLDPGALPTNFVVGRYAAMWAYPTVGTKTATSTQATGLTAFGEFALGELHTPPVCFGAPQAFPTGRAASFVAIGDLNRDGKPDLATANYGSDSVSVLLGNGDGTFAEKTDFEVARAPQSVAIVDLNYPPDGNPDLVVANQGADSVSVLLGNGDGTFEAKMDFATGSEPCSVAIADLNGDEKPDLAVANQSADSVSVLLGNGDGTFGAKTDFPTGAQPHCIAIADLNGDGKPDLAAANSWDATVSVLLGNGDGTFGAKTDLPTGYLPQFMAIADLNGDGKPDLAVVNLGDATVSVLLRNGDGTFGAKTDFPTGAQPHCIAIGDLNGDGKPDLAVPTRLPGVSVLLGKGDGTFWLKTDFPMEDEPSRMAIGDLNGDGKPDLAVADFMGTDAVSVLLNLGSCANVAVDPTPPVLPRVFQFLAPRPNPTRGASEIHFLLPTACAVDVALFDIAGRQVRSLASGELSTPGEHTIRWDGRDASGAPAHSGVYFVKVRAGRDVGVKRLIVLR